MKKLGFILILALMFIIVFSVVVYADNAPSTRSGYVALDGNGTAINIHSGYTVNSDACASCHTAHQAYNDPNLPDGSKNKNEFLMYNETSLCMACHDGTVTKTYDVLHGHIADAKDANGNAALTKGGLFAVQNAGNAAAATAISASEHPVFSNRNMVNIPGGKSQKAIDDAKAKGAKDGSDVNGAWSATDVMSCSSCHEAHGSGGNPRLLNPNPNLVMSQGTAAAGVQNAKIADFTAAKADLQQKYYFNNAANATQKVVVIPGVTKNALGTLYVEDSATTGVKLTARRPILTATHGGTVAGIVVRKVTAMNPFTATDLVLNTDYSFGFDTGKDPNGFKTISAYIKFLKDPGSAVITVDFTPALEVNMAIANKLKANEIIKYGNGMTQFCSACHTDYGIARGSVGIYNGLAHHTGSRTNSLYAQLGNYPVPAGTLDADGFDISKLDTTAAKAFSPNSAGSCLTCHFAHGVDATRWGDAGDKVVGNLTDPNGHDVLYQSATKGYGSFLAYTQAVKNGEANPLSKLAKETVGDSQMKRLPNFGTCITCHSMQKVSYAN